MNTKPTSFLLQAAKWTLIGLQVGLLGLFLCLVGAVAFYALRELGIVLLLFLIPLGAFFTWRRTRRYLAENADDDRYAIAYAARYFFLGAALGFLFSGCACGVAYNGKR